MIAALIAAASTRPAAQQPDRLRAAADAIGATNLKTIHYSGIGANPNTPRSEV